MNKRYLHRDTPPSTMEPAPGQQRELAPEDLPTNTARPLPGGSPPRAAPGPRPLARPAAPTAPAGVRSGPPLAHGRPPGSPGTVNPRPMPGPNQANLAGQPVTQPTVRAPAFTPPATAPQPPANAPRPASNTLQAQWAPPVNPGAPAGAPGSPGPQAPARPPGAPTPVAPPLAPIKTAPSAPASARPDFEEPAKPPKELSPGETPTPKVHWAYWAALGAVALLALVLRLRDPLSSGIMGAEDPYRHMERTWDLMQGNAPTDYPPGLMFLLMPFALMGQGTFYDVARFLPVLFGVALAVMTFLLCRKHMHPLGAAAAALLVAVMPETIRRSNVLFPTAIDLALIPLLFGLLIHAAYGGRRPVIHLAILGVVFMLVHPWVLGLIVPVAVVYWVGALWTQESRWRMPVTGGAAAGGFLLIVSAASWDFPSMIGNKALPKFGELMADPGSITPLPLYVDLPAMLGWPALALGAVGAVLTLMKPTKLGMLSLTWCLMLLPLILVDWFDMWYVPHRTVAYFAVGLAMLAGVAISEVVSFLPNDNPRKTGIGMLVVGAALMMLTVPTATAVEPWYRLYEEDDLKAWEELDEDDTEFVQAASWQARMGYRALTGRDAMYNPAFFTDENTRNFELDKEPNTVVIIDRYAREANVPTDFLNEGWHEIGTWGNTTAYARDGM